MAPDVTLDQLRPLREQLTVTQEDLGRSVGVSRQTIAAWEKGESTPTVAQLFSLARTLGVPVEILLGRKKEQDFKLLFRADQPETLTPEMREALAKKAANYATVEQLVDEAPATPPAYAMEGYNPDLVETVARQVRDWLGVDDGPLIDVIDRLEVLGVKVLQQNMPSTVSGFSAYTNEWGAVIFVNRTHPGERQIFTVLHELGHLVFHRKEYEGSYEKTRGRSDPREKAVQHFAGAVLLPADVLKMELRGWNKQWLPEPLLLDLKQRYHVSMRTVLFRAEQIGHLTKKQTGQQVGILNRKYGRGGEPNQFPPLKKSMRLDRLVFKALLKEKITISRAAEILETGVYQVREELTHWLEGLN
ncbi:helix-turn-helix domain protein [Desmospora sp. 8437]|nr:helix-turn-helix domain protein [Desmospora sp. 8437]